MFPRRKHCEWIEQGGDLRVRVCSDGEVLLWHDMATGDSWLPNEVPPKKWRTYFRKHKQLHGLGAAASAGVCPPHPRVAAVPSLPVKRLQLALQGLAKRTGDKFVSTPADGLIGPRTTKAVNRAMYMYAKGGAPDKLTTGALTKPQVVANAAQLASLVQRSPFPNAVYRPSPPPPDATGPEAVPTPAVAPAMMPEGDATMPAPGYYPSGYAPGYYQQPGYYPQRGPGGLPTDEASLDVRAFVPAQYEHIRVNPTHVMMAIGAVVVIYLVMDRKKKGA